MSGANGRGAKLDPDQVEWLELARVLGLDVSEIDPDLDALDDQDDPVGDFAIELARFQMGTEHQVDALGRLFDLAPEPSIEREQLRGLLTVAERLATTARDMGFLPAATDPADTAANDNPSDPEDDDMETSH